MGLASAVLFLAIQSLVPSHAVPEREGASLSVDATAAGVVVRPASRQGEPWRLSLSLSELGRDGARCPVPRAVPEISDERAVFERRDVHEWLAGAEHGFTVLTRPEGDGELELALDVRGGLRPSVLDGGLDVEFVDARGEPRVGYFGLHAWDADGRTLEARLREEHGNLVISVDDRDASFPLTVDPTFVSFEGSISSSFTAFGSQAALSGQTAFVGCRRSGPTGSGSSNALFFERSPTGWTFTQGFTGSAHYSSEVDVSGDYAVVGAPYLADLLYVYERSGGAWSHAQTIRGYTDGHDWYGFAVAIDGIYAGVTAPNSLYAAGPIWIYRRTAGGWITHTMLEDPGGEWAGESLDMSLPYAAVGDRDWGASDRGRVHVHIVPGTGGSGPSPVYVDIPDPSPALGDRFGHSVAIDGDRLLVGAPLHDHGLTNSGGAYVFERAVSGAWNFVAELVPNDPAAQAQLGLSVALDGDRAAVGGIERVYVFERVNGVWTQIAKLTPSVASNEFGEAVALEGTHLIVGARDLAQVFAYELSGAPGPATYCTAKVNSQGCTPSVGWAGVASATLAQPFFVTAGDVLNNKFGTFFYGVSGQLAAPFQGGFQCVAPPRRRTGLQWSGGNAPPDDCSGFSAYDFNARIQSGADPALVPGVVVDVQHWSRDGAASFQTGLSDALELTIGP